MKPARRGAPPLSSRIVQPYGRDKARQSTIISEGHATAAEAFAEIDRLSSEMVRTGPVQCDRVDRGRR